MLLKLNMRPAVLPCDACAPSCSGRPAAGVGFEGSLGWRRAPRRVSSSLYGQREAPRQQQGAVAAAGQQQQQAATSGRGVAAAPPPPTRTGAFSAALGYSSSTASAEATGSAAAEVQQQRSLLTAAEGQRDRDGDGLVRQRPRPLKINLDLALVRLHACKEGIRHSRAPQSFASRTEWVSLSNFHVCQPWCPAAHIHASRSAMCDARSSVCDGPGVLPHIPMQAVPLMVPFPLWHEGCFFTLACNFLLPCAWAWAAHPCVAGSAPNLCAAACLPACPLVRRPAAHLCSCTVRHAPHPCSTAPARSASWPTARASSTTGAG